MSISRCSSSVLFLLLSSNSFRFSNGQDAACGEAIESTTLGVSDACRETGGACPDSCASMFRDLHDTCAGKSYDDLGDVVKYDASVALGIGFFVSGACEDAPLSMLLERDDISCEDWLEVSSFVAVISCRDECTDSCKRVIDELYAACEATDEITDDLFADDDDFLDDAIEDDFFVTTAEEAEKESALFRHEECNAYADGLEWKTEATEAVLTTTSSPTFASVSIPALSTIPPTTSPTKSPTRGPVVAVTATPVSVSPTAVPTVLPTRGPVVAAPVPTSAAPTTKTAPNTPLQLAPVSSPTPGSTSASASLSSMWGLISASSIFVVCLAW